MTWVLFVCMGITGWGCGQTSRSPPMTKQECFEALAAVRSESNGKLSTGESGRQMVAFCRPKHPEEK